MRPARTRPLPPGPGLRKLNVQSNQWRAVMTVQHGADPAAAARAQGAARAGNTAAGSTGPAAAGSTGPAAAGSTGPAAAGSTGPGPRLKELIAEQEEIFVRRQPNSARLAARAPARLAGGVTSSWQITAPQPVWLSHGRGSKVYDVDGNEYVDLHGGYRSE